MSILVTGSEACTHLIEAPSPEELRTALDQFLAYGTAVGTRWEVVASFIAPWASGRGYCLSTPESSSDRNEMVYCAFSLILAKVRP